MERINASLGLLIYAALPLAYIVAGRLGLLLSVPPGYATAVFLPAGIAVAAMFIAGAASLPGTFCGSFLLNLWIGYSIAHRLDVTHITAALLIAAGSTLQAGIGGAALRKAIGYPASLDTPRGILLFLLLSPILCLTSATLSLAALWALGTVAAADLVLNWMTWWIGDTLGVIVALPLILVPASEPRSLARSRLYFVAIPMVLCFGLFVVIFARVSRWENNQALTEFRLRSQQVADAMKAHLAQQAIFLEQISSVFASRQLAVSRHDFHDLVQKLLQRFPTIQAVEWTPRVLSADREAFEAARQADFPGFVIRERNPAGQLLAAGERAQFYPVTYLEPLASNEEAVGFDLASETRRSAAVEVASATGDVAATEPIRLVQERGDQAGVLLMQAVSAGPSGPGIVLVVLRMGTVAALLAEPLQSTLKLRVLDAAGGPPLLDDFPATNPSYEGSFAFGGRRYVVETAPTAAYLAHHRGWQSWAVLAAGTLGTGLIGALLMLGTGNAYRFQALADALREREAELEIIIDRTPFMLIRCSLDLRYRFVSAAYAEMVGRRPEELVGKSIPEVIGKEGFKTVLPHINKVLSGERAEYESEVLYQGVGKRFLHGVYMPEKDEHGNVNGWIASIVDITERKRAESQRDLLVAELSHRVKNTLATVISIAHLSFSKARSAEEARPSFDDRIRALAQTHARLAEANWSGVSLAALIRDETAPYQDGARNVTVAGPDITLDPKCAVSLGMAIHELATNAAKHGALSAKGGSVQVTWERVPSQNEARLSWIESGGPAVSPPGHSGFGRMLLERALASDLNGKVKLEFRKEGLQCLIAFPLDQLSADPNEYIRARGDTFADTGSVSSASPPSYDRNRPGEARILVVEDESLLAMELEELLQSEGYSIVGPFSNLARATESALHETIDLALLDTNLNGEMVYPLADNLSARGIPFIFLTGYGASNLPERFRAAPRMAKPYDPASLTRELSRRTSRGLSSRPSERREPATSASQDPYS